MSLNETQIFELTIKNAEKCVPEAKNTPKVGAVAIREDTVLGEAFRGETGPGDHAEFALLEKKDINRQSLVGATIYTTLEPCTVRGPGKTPCAQRLADARVSKVVIGMIDPNPTIRGGGIEILRDAGVEVELYPAKYMARLEAINADFSRAQRALRSTLGNPMLDEMAAGAQLHASGRYRQATGHLEAALAATARWLASALLNTDSNYERMLAAAELAIAYDGTHYDQFFTAGYAQFKLGVNLEKARKYLIDAIQLLRTDRSRDVEGIGYQERWLQALGLACHISDLLGQPYSKLEGEYRQKLLDLRNKGFVPRPLGDWEFKLGY